MGGGKQDSKGAEIRTPKSSRRKLEGVPPPRLGSRVSCAPSSPHGGSGLETLHKMVFCAFRAWRNISDNTVWELTPVSKQYLFHLDFLLFQFHVKHFSLFSLCARLLWQLACHFSGANYSSYVVMRNFGNQSSCLCENVEFWRYTGRGLMLHRTSLSMHRLCNNARWNSLLWFRVCRCGLAFNCLLYVGLIDRMMMNVRRLKAFGWVTSHCWLSVSIDHPRPVDHPATDRQTDRHRQPCSSQHTERERRTDGHWCIVCPCLLTSFYCPCGSDGLYCFRLSFFSLLTR